MSEVEAKELRTDRAVLVEGKLEASEPTPESR